MPVVSTSGIVFESKPFRKVVKVSAGGEFSIALPEPVYRTLHIREAAIGNTLAEVERAFKKVLDSYAAAKTTKQKVILYRVRDNSAIMRDGCCIHSNNEISFTDGVTLSVWAIVCIESETTLEDGSKVYDYETVESALPTLTRHGDLRPRYQKRAEHFLVWTERREQFFCWVMTRLEDLILKLQEVSGDQKNLLEFIESGRLLELGSEKTEVKHDQEQSSPPV
jgi:hypothetical protein